jgi:thymidylate synthase ThyX
MNVKLLEYPTSKDWMEVKRRALVTIGKKPITPPSDEWKNKILLARHSPIRYLRFSFLITDLPSWVSVHLCRHVHAQPYVKSQRNDRQNEYDRNAAPQNAPVDMIWDINGEELCVIANKRLCKMASIETRAVVAEMCMLVLDKCPEFEGLLVPMCEYTGGCKEMNGGCGRYENHA